MSIQLMHKSLHHLSYVMFCCYLRDPRVETTMFASCVFNHHFALKKKNLR